MNFLLLPRDYIRIVSTIITLTNTLWQQDSTVVYCTVTDSLLTAVQTLSQKKISQIPVYV